MSKATAKVGASEELCHGRALIRASLSGTFEAEDDGLLTDWASGLNSAITSSAGGKEDSVCVLIDLRSYETYTDGLALSIIANLMKKDNPLVYKTATFGGGAILEMIESILGNMSKRDNLRNFRTEDEALMWLKS